jgi:hypothetical protein
VIETSVLVRAWRRADDAPTPSRRIVELAGVAYDSFTSRDILDEAAEVLARPRFALPAHVLRHRIDAFVRASRQVFAELVPGGDARAVGGDADDLPVLKTALAVFASASAYPDVVARSREPGRLLPRLGEQLGLRTRPQHARVHVRSRTRLPGNADGPRRRACLNAHARPAASCSSA